MTLPIRSVLLLLSLHISSSWACYAPPQEQLMSVDEQIAAARDVSLATVVRATPTMDGQTEYEFQVQKRIFGPDTNSFTLRSTARPPSLLYEESSFDKHQSEEFWMRGGGRLFSNAGCNIEPAFVVGHSYLAFVGQAVTRRSFERIASPDDKWLRYVENQLGGRPW